jgi:hypothetical protein
MKSAKGLISFLSGIAILLIFIQSCSTATYEQIYPTLRDGKYDSEFPYKGSSDALEQISNTIQRVNSTAFYKTYTFDQEDRITKDQLTENNLSDLTTSTGYADQSSSGTGTIIYSSDGKVALLTCAHVVNYPDTVLSFYSDTEGNLTEFLESIFIKDIQAIYVAGFPDDSKLEILAIDRTRDLAIIGRNYHVLTGFKFPMFKYPVGKAKELEWGTFVYVFGYPINYQMVTKAIVSSPNRDDEGSFLLDAVVNKGTSGGIVLAIRDGVPNFEIVGIVQWVPEEEDNILVPKKLKNNEPYNPIAPYDGAYYVKRFSSIRYGIAKIISVESVIEFLNDNRENLYEEGYYFEHFITE